MEARLINLFTKYLEGWSWEEWQAAGSSDREEVAVNAIADLGPDVDIEEAYDIFYDWAAGLTEADFSALTEGRSVLSRYASGGWYSGYARGLNDISNRVDDKELELKAKAEEERKRKEAEAKAKKEEAAKQAQLQLAQQAIDAGTWNEYNRTHKYKIRTKDWCPAIDPDTQQLVYDVQRKEEILKPIEAQLDLERAEQRRVQQQKDAERRAKERADAAITYCWRASATINGKTGYTDYRHIVGNDNPEAAANEVLQKEINFLKEEQKECRVFGEPFNWDGKVTIYCKDPTGKEEVYKVVSFKRK